MDIMTILKGFSHLLSIEKFAVLAGLSLTAQAAIAGLLVNSNINQIDTKRVVSAYMGSGFLGLSSFFFFVGLLFTIGFKTVELIYPYYIKLQIAHVSLTGLSMLLGTFLFLGGIGEVLYTFLRRDARFSPKALRWFNSCIAELLLPQNKGNEELKVFKVEIFTDGKKWFATIDNVDIREQGTSAEDALENVRKAVAQYLNSSNQ